jgi:hypothetical protein
MDNSPPPREVRKREAPAGGGPKRRVWRQRTLREIKQRIERNPKKPQRKRGKNTRQRKMRVSKALQQNSLVEKGGPTLGTEENPLRNLFF